MSYRVLCAVFGVVFLAHAGCGGGSLPGQSTPAVTAAPTPTPGEQPDHREDLRSALLSLSDDSREPLLARHFRSVIQVVEAGDRRVPEDSAKITTLWSAFTDTSIPHSPRLPESYLDRSRPLIVSWASPTDGQVSFAWLTLPARWDPEREYPVYVQLHGLWDVAQERIRYLAYPYASAGSVATFAFEDGYLVSPWGRGNLWYSGIAEADIWECLTTVKGLVHVEASRQYLCGHSMGGYGAWHIAHRSAGVWAALGIHAGALWYDLGELGATTATALRDVPTYFVVGTSDSLLSLNQTAYGLLRAAGNSHLAFVTFPGGHDYRQHDVEQMYLWMREFDSNGRDAAEQGSTARASR
jgi:surfactin synthase thioesterase subunit